MTEVEEAQANLLLLIKRRRMSKKSHDCYGSNHLSCGTKTVLTMKLYCLEALSEEFLCYGDIPQFHKSSVMFQDSFLLKKS